MGKYISFWNNILKILLVYSLFFYCNILFGATNSIVALNNNKLLLKTYGNEFNSFSKEQKLYLNNNFSKILKIIKQNIKYPIPAHRMKMTGTNKYSFFINSNGIIENIEMIESTRYSILDRNTMNGIEKVHKYYPKPKERTKIILVVKYWLP